MTFSKDEPITVEVVTKFMEKHKLEVARYEYLKNMYLGIMAIDDEPAKDSWKPDNRLAVNFTKYIVDTFTGYFNGIPVKKSHPDKEILTKLQEFDNLNDMEDEESELAKMACIYGRAFECPRLDTKTQKLDHKYLQKWHVFMVELLSFCIKTRTLKRMLFIIVQKICLWSMTIQSNKSLYLP